MDPNPLYFLETPENFTSEPPNSGASHLAPSPRVQSFPRETPPLKISREGVLTVSTSGLPRTVEEKIQQSWKATLCELDRMRSVFRADVRW